MPFSSIAGKKFIKKWFDNQKDIKTVLDLGVGCGTYSDLLKTFKQDYWIGIEIYKPYIEKYNLKEKYDKIIIGDIMKLNLPVADCVIAGDILEHLEKDDVKKFSKTINKYKHFILSIPLGSWIQGAVFGNKYEEHKSIWDKKEIEDIFDWKIKYEEDRMGIYIK